MSDLTTSRPTPQAVAERPLALLPAAVWIGLFSFREMVRRRRLVFLGLVALLPVLLTVAWRVFDHDGLISPELWMATLAGVVMIPFLVALVSLAVGISAIGEQVTEGTILYYWTRPLERSAIYLGRLLAAQTVAGVLLVSALALCFAVVVAGNISALTWSFLKLYLGNCLIVLVGAGVYTSIFVFLGTWLRRPLLPAILFAFGWESIAGHVPLKLQELTVVFHLRNLIRQADEEARTVGDFVEEIKKVLLSEQPVPEWHSLLALLGIFLVVTALGILLLRRKEIFR